MSLIKVIPYVLGMTPGIPGAPEPRMYPRSGYFLVVSKTLSKLQEDLVDRFLPFHMRSYDRKIYHPKGIFLIRR